MARKAASSRPRTTQRPASKPGRKPAPTKTPALEWASAAVGLAIVATVIGILVAQAAAPHGPPVLELSQGQQVTSAAGHTVTVEVTNDGGGAASDVLVEGRLAAGAEPETAEATIDYVPARSKRTAMLVFKADPKSGPLELRVKGYVEP